MPLDFAAEVERRRARVVTWWVPVKTPNPLNNSHGHWRVKQARASEHHEETVIRAPKGIRFCTPAVVVLRRYECAPQPLDDDGLAAALKHVRDGVAEVIGVDDGQRDQLRFIYEQERTSKRAHVGVRVTVIQGARVVETLEFVDVPGGSADAAV